MENLSERATAILRKQCEIAKWMNSLPVRSMARTSGVEMGATMCGEVACYDVEMIFDKAGDMVEAVSIDGQTYDLDGNPL